MSTASLGILQVNTSDSGGGAARVALDLHREYLARGVDSHVAVGYKHTHEPGVIAIPNERLRGTWARALTTAGRRVAGGDHPIGIRRLVSRGLLLAGEPARFFGISRGVEDFWYPGAARLLDLVPSRPDILHLHNLHGYYFDIRELPRLSSSQPTIVTMHDAWLLTGHCAHPIDCPGWRGGCCECRELDRYVPVSRDSSAVNRRIKRDTLGRSHLHYAAPSRWLSDLAVQAGIVDQADIRVIRNGVDTRIFAPGDRLAARRELDLPADAHILLAVGYQLRANPFKDFHTLAHALPLLDTAPSSKSMLVVLGESGQAADIGGVQVRLVGFVNSAAQVAQYYRAADVYVHPARAENSPLSIIEAMACGTAVVASRVGGIPEIIEDGRTGLLVDPCDAVALASALTNLLASEPRRSAYARAGVARVLELFTLTRQADEYLAWYEELRARREAASDRTTRPPD